MKKRILFATNYSGNDTTSYLRAWGPFTLMRSEVEIVQPMMPQAGESLKYGWWSNWQNWFNNIDVCFMHRPFGKIAAHIMSQCKMHGIPLWVDHDDDLLNIPEQNPHAKYHNDAEKEFPSIEMSYKYADILTCSGVEMHKQLKEKYGRKDAILITSGLDDRLLRFKRKFSGNKRVAWRGSESHLSDLEHFGRSIPDIVQKNPDRQFYFWGINPEKIWPELKELPPERWAYEDQLNFVDYISSITKANASVHYVPLEDNSFNRVKSNLSWLDCTLSGSVCVGPDYPEFNRPGIEKYKGVSDFKKVLQGTMDRDVRELEKMHDLSWEYICDNLLQSRLNKQRRVILKNL